jgi:predicted signal transduction protein with EAL and GGDEF domain
MTSAPATPHSPTCTAAHRHAQRRPRVRRRSGGRDAHDDVITRATVELADTLGLLTAAEGIETPEQQDHVAALGCDIAQGYLFSRPVHADAALELITGRSCAEPRAAADAGPTGAVTPT